MNCLITGSTVGIGKELAIKLASLGNNLFLTYYTNRKKIEDLQKKLQKDYGIKCFIEKLDLHDEENIKNLSKSVKEKMHNIDILINNASISNDNLFMDKTKNEFMNVLEVNVVGTFLISKYIIPLMNKGGQIINMSSTDGIDTYSIYNLDYAISKAGIIQLTKSMALIFKNIKTIAIAPNWVDTESTLEMNETYLKEELKRINQKKLIKKEDVALKIVNILNNREIKSGDVIRIYE